MSTSLIKKSQDLSAMRDIAARICRDYLTGAWKTISAEDIQLKKISGGLSNFLFYVSLPNKKNSNDNSPKTIISASSNYKRSRKDSFQSMPEPNEVLLRIYGQTHGEQALESMVTESVIFTLLSERKLGPKLHGVFPGGRIEQYIPARALITSELSDPKLSCKIAEKMAEIHSLDIPVSKEPDWLWTTMNRWIVNVETILCNSNSKNDKEKKHIDNFRNINFQYEIDWLKSLIESKNFQVVFSHNDLQEGNILYRDDYINDNNNMDRFNSSTSVVDHFEDSALDTHLSSIFLSPNKDIKTNHDHDNGNLYFNENSRKRSLTDDNNSIDNDLDNTRDSVLSSETFNDNYNDPNLMIIDFEYCAYNYRGFDLANHFLEWTFDYTNEKYPYYYNKKEQYPNKEQQEKFIKSYLTHFERINGNEDYIPEQCDINEIKDEVKCFTLASHLFWTLWSLFNVHQEIQFGYWDYAGVRSKAYFLAKENYIKSTKKQRNDHK